MKLSTICSLCLLLAPLATPVVAEHKVIAGWDRQLFPAYLIATAAVKSDVDQSNPQQLGDPNGQIGIEIEATEDDQSIEVVVQCDEFIEKSTFAGKLPEAGKTYVVTPKVRYRFDRLSQCKQATPATLSVQVKVDGQPASESSASVVFRSVNDCPLKVAIGDEVIDTKFTFAAFVNEQHPFVDKLLREALDRGIVERFVGYQGNDRDQVIRQVYALWDLMVARDVRYSDITATAADSNETLSQHVRLLEDTANNSQANCVDGSVLFVSMLRKIGIDAALVLEPGHCYMVFSTDAKGEQMYGLETTLIDAVLDDIGEVPEFLENAIEEESRGETSWPSFVAALGIATEKLAKNIEQYKNADNVDYEIINIAAARKLGVLPIPFNSTEHFVSFDHSASDFDADGDEEETEMDETEEFEEESEEE